MITKLVDVANEAGVSKSTVSQYLNGRYNYMSKETKARIEKAVKKLNYKPNILARSLKMKKTNTIGVIVSDIQMPFFTKASRGIDDCCRKNDYNIILCNTDNDPVREIEYVDVLRAKQVDGIIITYSGVNNEYLEKYLEDGIPTVMMDRDVEKLKVSAVVSENEKGAETGVKHLINIGYKDIGLVSPELKGPSRMKRIDGYRKAMEESGLGVDAKKIFSLKSGEEKQQLKKLYDKGNLPRALFLINGDMSRIVLEFCKENSIKVPEELALVGFDDIPYANLLDLTVIAQKVYEIGYRSAEMILDEIKNKTKEKKKERFSCELIIRKSCGSK